MRYEKVFPLTSVHRNGNLLMWNNQLDNIIIRGLEMTYTKDGEMMGLERLLEDDRRLKGLLTSFFD